VCTVIANPGVAWWFCSRSSTHRCACGCASWVTTRLLPGRSRSPWSSVGQRWQWWHRSGADEATHLTI